MLTDTKCGVALHVLRVKNYINVHTGVWSFLLFGVVGGVNSVTGSTALLTWNLSMLQKYELNLTTGPRGLFILQKGAARTGRRKAFPHRQVAAKDWSV